MNKKQGDIKHVAIYLRKSRDEGDYEDVLSKHRDTLVSIAELNNWTYELYEEVASGEKIENRPVMQKLLNDILDDEFDAVLVVDIDRLGRGEHKDWAIIKEAFLSSETLIVTPNKTYDLALDMDDMTFDFQSIFAKMEYKMIKKRLQNGKIAGLKKGMWINGKPPFPYYYETITKSIKVDEDKRMYYRAMVEKYLNGYSLTEITNWLSENMLTPYGISTKNRWSYTTIERILKSEVHLGYVIYGKSKYRKNRQHMPEEEWIKVKGNHEVIKSQEEHNAIINKLAKNKLKNPKARAGTLPLSGFLYCAQCGRPMPICQENGKDGIKRYKTRCENRFDKSIKCAQRSTRIDKELLNAIYAKVVKVDQSILETLQVNTDQMKLTKGLLQTKERELQKHKQALNKLYEMYEEDSIDKILFLERKAIRERQIQNLHGEIQKLQQFLDSASRIPTLESIKQRIEYFKKNWTLLTSSQEQNRLLRTLVDKIKYNRVGNAISLMVHYK